MSLKSIPRLSYLDLFSGIGGFRLGLQQAGFIFEYEAHSEINKYAEKVYQKHFPESEAIGDVRNVIPRIGDRTINLITFGFPCQDLSVAGRRQGLSGERSGLFYDAIEIIRHFKPEVFIFENVSGLLSCNAGKDFESVLRTIADIGLYECEWQLVNTAWLLPQNRERIYFIGHIRNGCSRKVFPIRASDKEFIQKRKKNEGQKDIAWALRSCDYKGRTNFINTGGLQEITKNMSEAQRIYNPKGISKCLKSAGGGQGTKTGLYAVPVMTPDIISKGQNGKTIKDKGEPMFTIDSSRPHGVMLSPCIRAEHHNTADVHFIPENQRIRRLTPIECARLQGFPDDWCSYLKTKLLSDSQQYKCYGNAVSVPIVKLIAERLEG